MKTLHEELSVIADAFKFLAHEQKIIRAAAFQMQDAQEMLADNERVIKEQRGHIEQLETYLRTAKDRCFDVYMNLASVLPLEPVKDEKPAKKKSKRIAV